MSKGKYIDGFVLAVPKKKLSEYKKIAQKAGKIWMEHGALEYIECSADDMKVQMGVPFPKLTKLKTGETVLFSWIVYKSRSHRNAVNAKVMKDKRMKTMGEAKDMPFDCKRMSYGGFKVLVDY